MEATYTLHICGCRGSRPISGKEFIEFGGQTSCYIIKTGSHAMVIDCGTGLYDAGPLLADCTRVDVVLTHVHYDHILGLLAGDAFPVKADLRFWGAFHYWKGQETLRNFFSPPYWPVQMELGTLCELSENNIYDLDSGIKVEIAPAAHPNGASLLHLCLGEKRVCLVTDCEKNGAIPDRFVRNCDLLLYDGMFEDRNYATYEGWGHSTWEEGCRLAAKTGVKELIITHHAPFNTDEVLCRWEQNAREMFAHTRFARAGDRVII